MSSTPATAASTTTTSNSTSTASPSSSSSGNKLKMVQIKLPESVCRHIETMCEFRGSGSSSEYMETAIMDRYIEDKERARKALVVEKEKK